MEHRSGSIAAGAASPAADAAQLRTLWDAASRLAQAPSAHAALSLAVDTFGREVGADAAALVMPEHDVEGGALRHRWGDDDALDLELLVGCARRVERAAQTRVLVLHAGERLAVGAPVVTHGAVRGALCAVFDRGVADGARVERTARAYALLLGLCIAARDELAPLREAASHDALTGCLNRRAILELLAEETARSERHSHPLACCMLDLDGFKAVNDGHGHLAGDHALAHVGCALRNRVRIYDCVGRYGGDEFLIVMPETPAAVAGLVAARLVAAVRDVAGVLGHQLDASVGVAEWERGLRPEQLVETADLAMLAAKAGGPGSVLEGGSAPCPPEDRP